MLVCTIPAVAKGPSPASSRCAVPTCAPVHTNTSTLHLPGVRHVFQARPSRLPASIHDISQGVGAPLWAAELRLKHLGRSPAGFCAECGLWSRSVGSVPPPPQNPPACKGGLSHIQQALRVLTCHHRLPRSAAASLRAE